MSAAYDLRYETREGRCAWCWEALGDTDSHAVVASLRPPHLELRFHHRCWTAYRAVSGVEGAEAQALYREWNPQRVEALRLHLGLTLTALAARLRVSKDRLTAWYNGTGRLGQKPLARLRGLAVDSRFEQDEPIDWSDRRACFCLCLHLEWNCGELGRRLGVKDQTVSAWWDKGVPKLSVRHWHRLTVLARRHGFDAGMLVDDRLWTAELAQQALAASGLTQAQFAELGGFHGSRVRDLIQGRRSLNRATAYGFTRAAARLNLPLPPVGIIPGKRRAKRGHFPAHQVNAKHRPWTRAELALVGTMPDAEVAKRLHVRTRNAVLRVRLKLDLPAVDARFWDGTPQPAPVPLDEVVRRYEAGRHWDESASAVKNRRPDA